MWVVRNMNSEYRRDSSLGSLVYVFSLGSPGLITESPEHCHERAEHNDSKTPQKHDCAHTMCLNMCLN